MRAILSFLVLDITFVFVGECYALSQVTTRTKTPCSPCLKASKASRESLERVKEIEMEEIVQPLALVLFLKKSPLEKF